MNMKLLRTYPNILARHCRQLDELKTTTFTEHDFMVLRKKQAFEMTMYHFITGLFKNKSTNSTFGYVPISKNVFENKNAPDLNLTCEIMIVKAFDILGVFQHEATTVLFKALGNLSYFYDMMVFSPVPIVVFPTDALKAVREFLSLCYDCKKATEETVLVFDVGIYELVLMEPYVALNFGLETETTEIIQSENIFSFFIGFIYQKLPSTD
ncbi:hypothetical protein THOM_2269 [Trachipleistophora hominis]|uniref:Uncharacterized protein n=1 Tax=Trachipleistophora hominis TaxID=72359 RepID=L7JVM8_TRAHO|nr:hypothetical protein THOM_2269 [Trachipleistophora hominis]